MHAPPSTFITTEPPSMTGITTERVPGTPGIAFDAAGEGPVVVFLHGIGGNRTNWHDQLPAFAARGFRAIAWDARGYGGSDDYEGPLDFADFSHDLARLLDHLEVGRAHLAGLSMGGRILQDFYPRYPDRVATLVLCATFPGFDTALTPEKRAEFLRLRKEPLVSGKEPKDIAPVVAKTLIGPRATEAHFQRLVESMTMLHKESYIKAIEASTLYDRSASLPDVAAPTLLVFGGADSLAVPAVGERMAEQIPGARLIVIPEAGHLVNIEFPEAFNEGVLAFLDEHRDS